VRNRRERETPEERVTEVMRDQPEADLVMRRRRGARESVSSLLVRKAGRCRLGRSSRWTRMRMPLPRVQCACARMRVLGPRVQRAESGGGVQGRHWEGRKQTGARDRTHKNQHPLAGDRGVDWHSGAEAEGPHGVAPLCLCFSRALCLRVVCVVCRLVCWSLLPLRSGCSRAGKSGGTERHKNSMDNRTDTVQTAQNTFI